MHLCIPGWCVQVIMLGECIQCLNGSNVKDGTREYLQQLAKRRLRVVNLPSEIGQQVTSTKSALRSAQSGVALAHHSADPQSSSGPAQTSNTSSAGHHELAVVEQSTCVQHTSMECVGASVGAPGGRQGNNVNSHVCSDVELLRSAGLRMDEAMTRAKAAHGNGSLQRVQNGRECSLGESGPRGKLAGSPMKAASWR